MPSQGLLTLYAMTEQINLSQYPMHMDIRMFGKPVQGGYWRVWTAAALFISLAPAVYTLYVE